MAEQFFYAAGTRDLEELLTLPVDKLLEAQRKYYFSAASSIYEKPYIVLGVRPKDIETIYPIVKRKK